MVTWCPTFHFIRGTNLRFFTQNHSSKPIKHNLFLKTNTTLLQSCQIIFYPHSNNLLHHYQKLQNKLHKRPIILLPVVEISKSRLHHKYHALRKQYHCSRLLEVGKQHLSKLNWTTQSIFGIFSLWLNLFGFEVLRDHFTFSWISFRRHSFI